MDKVKGNAGLIKATGGNTFASSWYAPAKFTGASYKDMFNNDLLKPYQEAYNKDGGAYKMQGLGVWLDFSTTESINADDKNGSLTITYMIASLTGAANTGSDERSVSIQKTITGFSKIDKNTAKDLFPFAIQKKGSPEHSTWKNVPYTNLNLLFETGTPGPTGWKIGKNIGNIAFFQVPSSEGYYLTLGGTDMIQDNHLCDIADFYLSTTQDNRKILIKTIKLNKKAGSDDLTISMGILGDILEWTISQTN
ncbi:MAG: hypothetical protein ACTTI3_01105 [Treponema sp.]